MGSTKSSIPSQPASRMREVSIAQKPRLIAYAG